MKEWIERFEVIQCLAFLIYPAKYKWKPTYQNSTTMVSHTIVLFPTVWFHNWWIRTPIVQAKQTMWAWIVPIEMLQVSVDHLFNGGAYEPHDLSCSWHPLLTGPMLTEHWPKKHIFVPMTSIMWGEFIVADMTCKTPFREFSTPTHDESEKRSVCYCFPQGFYPLLFLMCSVHGANGQSLIVRGHWNPCTAR